MGSKHDRIEARRENPKLDENPNFGIMKVFDEAKGSRNVYCQGHSSDWSLLKIFRSSEWEQKVFGINRGSEIYRKDRNQTNRPRSSRWLVAWVQNVVSTI